MNARTSWREELNKRTNDQVLTYLRNLEWEPCEDYYAASIPLTKKDDIVTFFETSGIEGFDGGIPRYYSLPPKNGEADRQREIRLSAGDMELLEIGQDVGKPMNAVSQR